MTPEEEKIKNAVINLLYDLHSFNKLDIHIVDAISRNFSMDAVELCDLHGITYNLE